MDARLAMLGRDGQGSAPDSDAPGSNPLDGRPFHLQNVNHASVNPLDMPLIQQTQSPDHRFYPRDKQISAINKPG